MFAGSGVAVGIAEGAAEGEGEAAGRDRAGLGAAIRPAAKSTAATINGEAKRFKISSLCTEKWGTGP